MTNLEGHTVLALTKRVLLIASKLKGEIEEYEKKLYFKIQIVKG